MPFLDEPSGFGADADKLLELMSSLWDNTMDPDITSLFKRLGTDKTAAEQNAARGKLELEQATNAPRPETNAAADVATRGLARGAAGLLRTEEPVQRNEQAIKDKQTFLLEQREDNLKRLAESYKRASDRAEKLGDLETEIKFKEQFDKITEKRKELGDALRLIYQQTHQDWRSQIRAAMMSAVANGQMTDSQLGAMMKLLESGQGAVLSKVPTKDRGRFAEKAVNEEATFTDPAVRTAVGKIGEVYGVIHELRGLFNKVPAGKPGDMLDRAKKFKDAKIGAMKQEPGVGMDAAEYERNRDGFKARVSQILGQVGVLTEKDVEYAAKMLPIGGWDSREYGERQFKRLENYIAQKKISWLRAYTEKNAGVEDSDPAGILDMLPER